MPVMNLPSMNPPAFGEVSKIGKLGNVRPDIINGGRFPSNSIWPSRQEICIVFTVEPFAPELTINCKLFSGNLHSKPAGKHTLQIKAKRNFFYIGESDLFGWTTDSYLLIRFV